ncbi:hypothetical protein C900_02713 [Fulvivirga imtechensis AK7]|uniref:Uncharacterized protein n=1 Tax=Fulvivirga imtechensis AK7 TaxID=1237149 RepID=L8JZP6_9BACT|nr:hypothetical protein C900_02713 [Fulvivirga imtechensis AK7]
MLRDQIIELEYNQKDEHGKTHKGCPKDTIEESVSPRGVERL